MRLLYLITCCYLGMTLSVMASEATSLCAAGLMKSHYHSTVEKALEVCNGINDVPQAVCMAGALQSRKILYFFPDLKSKCSKVESIAAAHCIEGALKSNHLVYTIDEAIKTCGGLQSIPQGYCISGALQNSKILYTIPSAIKACEGI